MYKKNPNKLIVPIIVDTREQQPLKFSKYQDFVKLSEDHLLFGDYSISGHDLPDDDDSIIIERKQSCSELARNLGKNWDRFERELIGMSKYRHKLIVVEDNNTFQELYDNKFITINPEYMMKQISTIYLKYNIPVLFLGSPTRVESFLIRTFYAIVKKHDEDPEA